MTRYFADTFYYLALLNDRDEAHRQAVVLNARLSGGIVTTQCVLTDDHHFEQAGFGAILK